ncbi:probable G-protein coupled receptor 21 [Lytechinus variegatus]|uniref:probable G-protein coupled receptor 21 n=1 Tax=Lytechinus variegatus TaxID=7654 RepID=UPI001BB18857|nr:probable G-protein coupled receptor 21 [Lytechinus variegatus]
MAETSFGQLETSTDVLVVTRVDYDFDLVHVAFCSTMSVLILISNAFIVCVLKKGSSCFDEVTSFLFKILAYTDIIGGAVGALIHGLYFISMRNQIADTVCRYVPFCISFCALNSLYLVCLINVQRYVAVTRPFKYIRLATTKRFKVVVCISNAFVICLTVIVLPIEGFPFTPIFLLMCRDQYRVGDIISRVETTVGLSILVIAIAIPLILLSILNLRLLAIAYRASHRLHTVSSRSHRDQEKSGSGSKSVFEITEANVANAVQRRRGLKGLKTVIAISVLFYVSCLPYAVALILTMANGEQSYYLYFVALALLLCNCWWNGPVYFFTSRTFRKKSLEVLGFKKTGMKRAEVSTNEHSLAT